MDDNDMLNQDFVRREYALALKCKKNVVPVFKEDFEFPPESRLPDDVSKIVSFNAIKWVGEYKEASVDKNPESSGQVRTVAVPHSNDNILKLWNTRCVI